MPDTRDDTAPLTVGQLKALLADAPDSTWVCLREGPATHVFFELGANEPFIAIEGSV